MLDDLINNQLIVLLGLQIRYIGRAGNMAWLGFGEDIVSFDHNDLRRVLAKYALHIQCAFRIDNSEKILFGSYDVYEPKSDTGWFEGFNWDVKGANYYDEQAAKLTAIFNEKKVTVTKIVGTTLGDFIISLSNGMRISVFVNGGTDSECWRFFGPEDENPHFVVTGQGIEV